MNSDCTQLLGIYATAVNDVKPKIKRNLNELTVPAIHEDGKIAFYQTSAL
jgi:hypothetical protein